MNRTDLALLLPLIDNPMNEDRWGDAKAIADRAGINRRAIGQKLLALEHAGLVESMPQYRSQRAKYDPPRLWRRRRDA